MPTKKPTKKVQQSHGAPITRFFKPSQESVPMTTRRAAAIAAAGPATTSCAKPTPVESQPRSRKRSRTPDARQPVPEPPKTPARTKSRAADCLIQEQENVAVTQAPGGTPNPQQKKKTRYMSPEPPASESSMITIPSSQSNEEELTVSRPIPSGLAISTCIPATAEWARTVLPPTPDQDDRDHLMLVDDTATFSSQTGPSSQTSFVTAKTSDTTPQDLSPLSKQPPTPPLSDFPSFPPTPAALDTEAKTAQLIAKIKAQAYQEAACTSPEPSPARPEFRDELTDESDEEDLDAPVFLLAKKPAAKASAKLPTPPPVRTSARLQAKKSPGSGSPASDSKGKGRALPSVSPPRRTKASSSANPLQRLLKEKRGVDKNGTTDHFQRAENIASRLGDTHLSSFDSDDDDDELFGDSVRTRLFTSKSTESGGSVEDLNFTLDDDVKKELLDAGGEEAGLNVLVKAKTEKKKGRAELRAGIQFWADGDNSDMEVDATDPHLVVPGTHLCITKFNAAMAANNSRTVQLILESNMLSLLPSSQRAPAVRSLFDLALSPSHGALSAMTMHALQQYWCSSPEKMDDGFNLPTILAAFQRAGASNTIFEAMRWKTNEVSLTTSERSHRAVVASRIASGLATCAEYNRLREREIPDLIACLLLLASDLSASPDLQRDVIVAIDNICDLTFSESCTTAKRTLACRKITDCIALSSEGKTKVHILGLLAAGGEHARPLAAAVAYNTLHDLPAAYREAPSLMLLIDWLSSNSSPGGRFVINADTDYEALAADVALLGFVLLNLKAYLLVDEKTRQASDSSQERRTTTLQQLFSALDTLHNRIPDIRAAYLDRTRVKAHIKNLSMHIHYCRRLQQQKRSSIKSYFTAR